MRFLSPVIVCGLSSLVLIAWITGPAAALEWRPVGPRGSRPSERRGVAGLHDAPRGRLVFQGGETPDGQFLSDVWYFDLASRAWTRSDVPEPNRRCHHTFVMDDAERRGLLFGGFPRTNRLWSWDAATGRWSELTPDASPVPRCLHSSVVDERRGRMVVYGGLLGAGTPDLSDTWVLDLGTDEWRVLTQDSPPGMRYGHVAAMDADRDRMIVFGGFAQPNDVSTAQDVSDLWAFEFATLSWVPLQPATAGPAPRQFARGATLPDDRGLIIFGGLGDFSEVFNDLWHLDLEALSWTRLEPSGGPPPPRFRHTVILSEDGKRLWVAFGEGPNRAHYDDIWELDLSGLVPAADGR